MPTLELSDFRRMCNEVCRDHDWSQLEWRVPKAAAIELFVRERAKLIRTTADISFWAETEVELFLASGLGSVLAIPVKLTFDSEPLRLVYKETGVVAGTLRPPMAAGSSKQGRKDDAGKLDWSLLTWQAVADVVRVLGYGAKKYAPDNWRKVVDPDKRYFAAAMRHLVAWRCGERLDPESGLPHLAHAACSLLFLLAFEQEKNQEGQNGKGT